MAISSEPRIFWQCFCNIVTIFNLCSLQYHTVGSPLAGKSSDFGNLMLVVTEDDELYCEFGIMSPQLVTGFGHISNTLDYRLQTTSNAVTAINILCGAIDRNNQLVKTATDKVVAKLGRECLAVGRHCGEDAPTVGLGNHSAKVGVERGLALKKELTTNQPRCQRPQGVFECFHVHQLATALQTTTAQSAFGTLQVAHRCRFN